MVFFKLIFTVSARSMYLFVFCISVSSQTLRSPMRCSRAGVTQRGALRAVPALPSSLSGRRAASAMVLVRHKRSHHFIWKSLRLQYLRSAMQTIATDTTVRHRFGKSCVINRQTKNLFRKSKPDLLEGLSLTLMYKV